MVDVIYAYDEIYYSMWRIDIINSCKVRSC